MNKTIIVHYTKIALNGLHLRTYECIVLALIKKERCLKRVIFFIAVFKACYLLHRCVKQTSECNAGCGVI